MDSLPGKCRHSIKSFLLLVNLFVARTLGNCPKPALEENIILTNEALLMNDFPDDVEITLTCANGYVKDSGTGTIKCTDGAWSDLDLTCKKKDCGTPLPQAHMMFDISQGTLFGAVAVVICDKGYMVKGSSYKHCYNTGWTGKSTKCLIVTCEIPEKVANGINSWNSDESPKYGENIQFFCNEGYTLTGKDSITCTEDGEYDAPAPQCLREDILTDEDNTTTTTTTLSPTESYYFPGDRSDDIVETKKDVGYTPVIISVVCVSLVAFIVVLCIHKLLLRRKGSYDTREDLKPELLQFQNL